MSESRDLPSSFNGSTIVHIVDGLKLLYSFIICELLGYFPLPLTVQLTFALLFLFFSFFRVTLAFIGISLLVIGTTLVGQLPDSR